MNFDVIVIGGGASGLFCASIAAARGKKVLLLESSNKIGKKILMSGGGRCNFTNLNTQADFYLSDNPHFCKSALSRYTQWDFIALVEKHGIEYEERQHGQLFCRGSSKEIVVLLKTECDQAGVRIHTDCKISIVDTESLESGSKYTIKTNLSTFVAPVLVVASGGLSIPKMGATNFAYRLARQFNLPVIPTSAALVPFTFSDPLKTIFQQLSGVSHAVILSTGHRQFSGNILFTHRGLSGPAALQLSSYWCPGEVIRVNFFPHTDMRERLLAAKREFPKVLLRTLLMQHGMAKSLVLVLQELIWVSVKEKQLQQISAEKLDQIACQLSAWHIMPSGTEGYRTAEVTKGGVDTRYFSSKTMECKSQRGLYFIGEALDVTGHLGGFNFQWAWSSAYAAAMAL